MFSFMSLRKESKDGNEIHQRLKAVYADLSYMLSTISGTTPGFSLPAIGAITDASCDSILIVNDSYLFRCDGRIACDPVSGAAAASILNSITILGGNLDASATAGG
jgi:hypothetical protein